MLMMRPATVAALLFVLAACSNDRTNDFVDACMTSGNMQRPVCECLADKASRELPPAGFELLIASMHGDDQRADQLRDQLEMPELMSTGMFMVNAPSECTGGSPDSSSDH